MNLTFASVTNKLRCMLISVIPCVCVILQARVKKRNDQITNMNVTNKSLMAQLNRTKAAMEEAEESKKALEIEFQQFKVGMAIPSCSI